MTQLRRLQRTLDRYGDAVEQDVAFRTSYRMSMFVRGEERWLTLANLVAGLVRIETSFLYAAMITDVEAYEETVDLPEGPPGRPDFVNETGEVKALRTISEQLQASNWYATRQKGAPKIKRIPRPESAKDTYMAREARKSFESLEASIVFVRRPKPEAETEGE